MNLRLLWILLNDIRLPSKPPRAMDVEKRKENNSLSFNMDSGPRLRKAEP